jgi:hypothetical protein
MDTNVISNYTKLMSMNWNMFSHLDGQLRMCLWVTDHEAPRMCVSKIMTSICLDPDLKQNSHWFHDVYTYNHIRETIDLHMLHVHGYEYHLLKHLII